MQVDYIIVGLGLAGLAFAETLQNNNKCFIVFEDASQNSSKVAAGMYNPVVLKRFTPVWNAKEQLQIALPFFKSLEKKFNAQYLFEIPIKRVFKSIEEQNNWFVACDNPLLKEYMVQAIEKNKNKHIIAPFALGNLINTGKLDINALLNDYTNYLKKEHLLINETFKHANISFTEGKVLYQNIRANHLVFCEGFGLKDNPFFNHLPMNEVKGELITIHAPELQINFMLKAAIFVLPLGDDLYKVGATFNWKDKTAKPSQEGKKELIKKLEKTIESKYTIIDHIAGIRPTIKDRRPLVGIHPKHKQLAILNGLGTRGVMIAPLMAEKLFDLLEKNIPLEKEINIERFK